MGCLQTRSDIALNEAIQFNDSHRKERVKSEKNNESGESKQKKINPQREAGLNLKLQENQELIRNLVGRIDFLERNIKDFGEKEKLEEKVKKKFKIYEEALFGLEKRILELNEEIKKKKKSKKRKKNKKKKSKKRKKNKSSSSSKSSYEVARTYFSEKKWKKAILSYQKYREENLEGKAYIAATYNIGISFKSLGLHSDAESFFKEVISKSPKSSFAKKSKLQLKKIQ